MATLSGTYKVNDTYTALTVNYSSVAQPSQSASSALAAPFNGSYSITVNSAVDVSQGLKVWYTGSCGNGFNFTSDAMTATPVACAAPNNLTATLVNNATVDCSWLNSNSVIILYNTASPDLGFMVKNYPSDLANISMSAVNTANSSDVITIPTSSSDGNGNFVGDAVSATPNATYNITLTATFTDNSSSCSYTTQATVGAFPSADCTAPTIDFASYLRTTSSSSFHGQIELVAPLSAVGNVGSGNYYTFNYYIGTYASPLGQTATPLLEIEARFSSLNENSTAEYAVANGLPATIDGVIITANDGVNVYAQASFECPQLYNLTSNNNSMQAMVGYYCITSGAEIRSSIMGVTAATQS